MTRRQSFLCSLDRFNNTSSRTLDSLAKATFGGAFSLGDRLLGLDGALGGCLFHRLAGRIPRALRGSSENFPLGLSRRPLELGRGLLGRSRGFLGYLLRSGSTDSGLDPACGFNGW